MTEHIYGPLHKDLTSKRVSVTAFQGVIDISYDIMSDFRFNLVKDDLSRRIKDFQDKLTRYSFLLSQAHHETEFHISMGLSKHEIKAEVIFAIWSGGQEVFRFPLREPIFRDKTPLDFLNEKAKLYPNTSMIVYVGNKSEGKFSNEHRIHHISKEILTSVRKDATVQQFRRERKVLLKECTSLLEAIENEFVL